jgi:hypothetical protein
MWKRLLLLVVRGDWKWEYGRELLTRGYKKHIRQ